MPQKDTIHTQVGIGTPKLGLMVLIELKIG